MFKKLLLALFVLTMLVGCAKAPDTSPTDSKTSVVTTNTSLAAEDNYYYSYISVFVHSVTWKNEYSIYAGDEVGIIRGEVISTDRGIDFLEIGETAILESNDPRVLGLQPQDQATMACVIYQTHISSDSGDRTVKVLKLCKLISFTP